jgi:D-alanine-D-alanine ligase
VPCADGVVVDPRRGREAAAALAARGEVVVKPNYGGSSDGIDEHSIASDPDELPEILDRMLPVYPEGVLVEEYVAGTDVTVGLVVSSLQEVLLPSVEYLPEDAARTDHNLLAHAVKNDSELWSLVGAECPAPLEPDVEARLASLARTALTAVGLRDLARVDFRLGGERSSPILLELNAIPAVEEGTGVCIGAAARGWSIDDVVAGLTESALERARREPRRSSRPARRVREVS